MDVALSIIAFLVVVGVPALLAVGWRGSVVAYRREVDRLERWATVLQLQAKSIRVDLEAAKRANGLQSAALNQVNREIVIGRNNKAMRRNTGGRR